MEAAFTNVRLVFRTTLTDFLDDCYERANQERRVFKKDEFKSMDAFIAAAGGDSARRTYYRVMAALAGKEVMKVREGAFTSLIHAVGRSGDVDHWELKRQVLNFEWQGTLATMTESDKRLLFLSLEESFESFANKTIINSLKSEHAFADVVMRGLWDLKLNNSIDECLARASCEVARGCFRLGRGG